MITTKDLTDPIGKRFQWAGSGSHGYCDGGHWDTRAWFDVECINTRVAGILWKHVECAVKPPIGPPFWVKASTLRPYERSFADMEFEYQKNEAIRKAQEYVEAMDANAKKKKSKK